MSHEMKPESPNGTFLEQQSKYFAKLEAQHGVDAPGALICSDLARAQVIAADGDDILFVNSLDPALNLKMHLINNVGYAKGLTIATYVGMLAGAIFWGFGADIIGRKIAFNTSLFICSISCIIAGAMPSWASLGFFVALLSFGAGGNLIMDTAVLLEYLPSNKQWLLTLLACWWGFGQAITDFIAWGFLVPEKWNCADVATCTRDNNLGWRYVMFTGGSLVFVLSVLRITVIRLRETPKYLLGVGKEEELVKTFQQLAKRYSRPCSITTEILQSCGSVTSAHAGNMFSVGEAMIHLRGLFSSRKMRVSTSGIILSWTLIGLAYPLLYVFLPGIPGPIVAGFMCNTKLG
ncbi:major facilitator superfamily transporter [Seiridium cupressi]